METMARLMSEALRVAGRHSGVAAAIAAPIEQEIKRKGDLLAAAHQTHAAQGRTSGLPETDGQGPLDQQGR